VIRGRTASCRLPGRPTQTLKTRYRRGGRNPYRLFDGGIISVVRPEPCSKPDKSTVQRDLCRVRRHLEPVRDLRSGQVRAVPERDQLPVPCAQREQGVREGEPLDSPLVEASVVGGLGNLAENLRRRRERGVDAPPGDAEQPDDRLALRGVVALAVS